MKKIIGFTCSAFDLLHAGHVAMLQEAKGQCDYLIAGLQTDPSRCRPNKNQPIQNLVERQIQLLAVKYVDEVVCYETEQDLEEILKLYPIDIRIVGEEYRNRDFTGKTLCKENGIRIYYNRRIHSYSTKDLRNRIRPVVVY